MTKLMLVLSLILFYINVVTAGLLLLFAPHLDEHVLLHGSLAALTIAPIGFYVYQFTKKKQKDTENTLSEYEKKRLSQPCPPHIWRENNYGNLQCVKPKCKRQASLNV